MSRFKKKTDKGTPGISTASLPDIVFMLLFFFMVATKMRDASIMVKSNVPQATELVKLEHKNLVMPIFIGQPLKRYQAVYGTSPRVQLGDKFADDPSEIAFFVQKFRAKIPEAQHGMIFASIKGDKDITCGIVSDVKTELRKVGQLKVNYSAKPRPKK